MCDCELKDNACQNEECAVKDVDISTLEGWAGKIDADSSLEILKTISTAYQDLRAHLEMSNQMMRGSLYHASLESRTIIAALIDKGVIADQDFINAHEKVQQYEREVRDKMMEEVKQKNMEPQEENNEE